MIHRFIRFGTRSGCGFIPFAFSGTLNIHTNSHQSYIHILPNNLKPCHARLVTEGLSSASFYATHLVKSYAKANDLSVAKAVFESVPKKRMFLYNAMIRACSINEEWFQVAQLYSRMEDELIVPDHYTLPFVIKSFSMIRAVEEGKKIHVVAKQTGLIGNVHVATALIEMYAEFNQIGIARLLFDEMPDKDIVAWTAMLSGNVKCGNHAEALILFNEMRSTDVQPNWITVLSLIPACDNSVHAFVLKSGMDLFAEVETTLLSMYAKTGDVVTAYDIFSQSKANSLISWTAMVGGYSQNGYANEALNVFYQMLNSSEHRADAIVAVSVLQACAQLGSLSCAEMINGYLTNTGIKTGGPVETALINMYAKCGNVNAAELIFKESTNRSMIVWSALVAGYGYHGHGIKALNLFEQMKNEGFIPDELAFLSILSACSHSGLVAEGKACFDSMMKIYKMVPQAKHYACLVDLLGRAGLVDEACEITKNMQLEADENVWGSLLSAARVKGNLKVAEFAFQKLLKLHPDNTEYNVLLANMYASCGNWEEMSRLRSVIRSNGGRKIPGCSYIEVNSKTHSFYAGDESHPDFDNICYLLELVHSFDCSIDLIIDAEACYSSFLLKSI